MNIFQEWCFKDNPFKTTALPAEIEGDRLIAGREQEIRRLIRRIYNQPQIPTLEGVNGIGKTSIINVSLYRCFLDYIGSQGKTPLFIPCIKSFQLSPDINADDFTHIVYIEVAQTIIRYKDELMKLRIKLPKNIDEIGKWLNNPYSTSYEGSIGALTVQVGGGKIIETNTSTGFELNGFNRVVNNWLEEMFPNENSGGIACIIDNLEILEKSTTARKVIEVLRDKLFSIQGIRWIMCGSLGIITSIVSSPRLEGLLHEPIQVGGILKKYLDEVFDKRIDAFKLSENYYLPLTKQSFTLLYEILKQNIRNTLKFANDYCTWIDDKGLKPSTNEEKETCFLDWLLEKSNIYFKEIQLQIKPRTLKLFKDAVSVDGIFSLSDYELFNYKSAQSMRNCIRSLESVGLIICVIDESDSRRKSIQITPKGWFVSNVISS